MYLFVFTYQSGHGLKKQQVVGFSSICAMKRRAQRAGVGPTERVPFCGLNLSFTTTAVCSQPAFWNTEYILYDTAIPNESEAK